MKQRGKKGRLRMAVERIDQLGIVLVLAILLVLRLSIREMANLKL